MISRKSISLAEQEHPSELTLSRKSSPLGESTPHPSPFPYYGHLGRFLFLPPLNWAFRFRKIAGIECYAPSDNVSELTARANDDGWDSIFSGWLKVSNLNSKDVIFIFSVGGGNLEKNISPNLVKAIDFAGSIGSKIIGVVGRDGGYTALKGTSVVIIPTVNEESITPHSEAFQAVVWHLLVTHPKIKANQTKWESQK